VLSEESKEWFGTEKKRNFLIKNIFNIKKCPTIHEMTQAFS